MQYGKCREEKNMKEIGGYIEFEYFHGKMLHENGIKLDCGRDCLHYLIKARKIDRLCIPSFMCDAVFDLCRACGVQMDLYETGYDFKPRNLNVHKDAYLYLCNFYGQLSNSEIAEFCEKYPRIIIDNAQSYYSDPLPGTDTLYTCRKFFGVPDGGILFTEAVLDEEFEQAESFEHIVYLMGRLERNGTEFYQQNIFNNDRFDGQPVRRMSKLTENILHGLDYDYIKKRREDNFRYLHDFFGKDNRLDLTVPPGPYAYPLLIENAAPVRKKLVQEKIYIPVLWPNVREEQAADSTAYDMAENILPLPCDQRYGEKEMARMCELIQHCRETC